MKGRLAPTAWDAREASCRGPFSQISNVPDRWNDVSGVGRGLAKYLYPFVPSSGNSEDYLCLFQLRARAIPVFP